MAASLGFVLTEEQQAFAAEHVRLAYREAHRMAKRTGIAYDELQGAAIIGLCKGAATFDASMGWKPSTYLCPKIRGELLHYCRDKTYLLKIPHRVRELWMRGRKYLPFGRSDQWIAEELQVPLEEWLDCRSICSGPPLELNDTVHEVQALGKYGENKMKESDRTEAYLEAAEAAWRALPSSANALFWSVKGAANAKLRSDAVEQLLGATMDALAGADLPEPEAVPLAAACYGDDDSDKLLVFEAEDLGNGKTQLSLF